ncbi:MAG: hypothetical protein JWQ81_855 [Amycolatopsis sp.]|uniref:hypothetical protein n=1 Tax=Amycolatopsis sp. TaxID=37632 RepID=UPI00263218F1|nr:hypothetical protein [Amycolatopsis sp.]MCU1680116.1 hypothetical protein [Amycolatopsis sp.]
MPSFQQEHDQLHRIPFSLYEVTDWRGTGALDFFQVEPQTSDATEIWFAYTNPSQDKYILLGNIHMATRDSDADMERQRLASQAVTKLLNLGIPESMERIPVDMSRKMGKFIDTKARSWKSWPTVTLTVDGDAREFSEIRFGGAAAFLSYPTENVTAIIAVYQNVELQKISLQAVENTDQYGFSLNAGIRFQDLEEGSFVGLRDELHPDYDLL